MNDNRVICLVTNDISQDQRMIRICETLQSHGYKVTLVGRKLQDSKALPFFPFITVRLWVPFRQGFLFYLTYNLRLFLFLLFKRVDVINAVDYDTLLPATLVGILRGKKVVLDAHEWFEEVPELIDRPAVRHAWERIAYAGIPMTHGRYTVSAPIAEALSKKYRVDFEVIHNYPLMQNQEQSHDRKRRIVYVGVLNVGRGLEQMIDAMRHIDAELWLVGKGDIETALKQQVEDLQLQSKVQFTGFLDREGVLQVLSGSYLGINLLEDTALSYRYSLANKFFDYVQYGLPQITMDFPTYASFNHQHEVAILIKDLQSETLSSAVNDLLNDKEKWQSLHHSTQLARKVWSWEIEVPRLVSLYNKLLAPD